MGGGVDSTALIPFFLGQGFSVRGVHFDYAQPAAIMERKAAHAIAAHYGIELFTASVQPMIKREGPVFQFRNATLLLAAAQMSDGPCLLAIGVHADTPFYDCSPEFIELIGKLVAEYSLGAVRVVAPWKDIAKGSILDFSRENRVPLELTYSCQIGGVAPCDSCLSCRDRVVAIG